MPQASSRPIAPQSRIGLRNSAKNKRAFGRDFRRSPWTAAACFRLPPSAMQPAARGATRGFIGLFPCQCRRPRSRAALAIATAGCSSPGCCAHVFDDKNLAEEDADAADAEAVEALKRTLQALDVSLPFRQGAQGRADAALGLRGQGAEPVGDLIRGRNFHRRGSADGIGFCRPWRRGSRSWRRDRQGRPWFP